MNTTTTASEEANQKANRLFTEGDVKGAIDGYSQAIGIAPKAAKYYGNRSNAYMQIEKFQKAAHDAEKAIELDGTVPKYYFRAARSYIALRQWVPALSHISALRAVDPTNADAPLLQQEAEAGVHADFDPMTAQGAKVFGELFLLSLDSDTTVYKLPSGLRFRILAKPTSESALSPTLTDECKVHYHGTLTNGNVFDSSYARKDPITFAPSQVIPGWTEALQYMAEGEKWEVYLPSNLAYGSRGAQEAIPPNATLIFTIELFTVLTGTRQKTVVTAHTYLEAKLGMAYNDLVVSEPRVPVPSESE